MFSKFSFKTKVILFIAVFVVAVVSIAYNSNFQLPLVKNAASSTKGNVSSTIDISKTEKEKAAEEAKKAEEDAKKAEAAKQQALEEEYKNGHDIYDSGKDKLECIKVMDDILSKDDKFYKAYTLKGIALCDTTLQNRFQEAMTNLDKALEIKPDYGYGLFNKAYALEKYSKYSEAIYWYEKALEVEKFVWSYYGIASIYGRSGDVANTVKYLKLAIEVAPDVDVKNTAREESDFINVKNSAEFQELLK